MDLEEAGDSAYVAVAGDVAQSSKTTTIKLNIFSKSVLSTLIMAV